MLFSVIKNINRKFKAHPVATILILFSYVISILIISIGTSSVVHIKQTALERTEGSPKNALVVNCSVSNKIKFKQYIDTFNKINRKSNLIFLNMRSYIDNANKDMLFDVTGELFKEMPDWTYPLLKGRYYNTKEVEKGSKVVLIGKDLEKYITNYKNEKSIKIDGEKYKVIGIIGKNNKSTPWDSRLFMPITSISDLCKMELLENGSFNFILHNTKNSTLDDCNNIKRNFLNIDKQANFNVSELENKDDTIANIFGNNVFLIFIGILIFVISLINTINITYYWINERKIEIGIRKAFGHTNLNISSLLFNEMLSIGIISCIISLSIQCILNLFFDKICNFSIKLTVENFIFAFIAVIIATFITSIIPIYKALKIQPIDILKS